MKMYCKVHQVALASKIVIGLVIMIITGVTISGVADAAVTFKGKTITFVVPVTPGGGFDTATRMLVPYLKKHLPGNPNVIVKNTPGGEWNIGINKMYRAKPDGRTVAILNMPGNAVSQVVGTAKFDLRKITWLGNISLVTYVTALSPKSGFRTLEDCQKAKEVVSGVVGLASTAGLGTIIAGDRMGITMKPIPHGGSSEAILGAIRGDLDWVQYPFTTLKKSSIDSTDLVPAWVFSRERLAQLPDVPTVAELGYEDLLDIVAMYRPVGAPPGLPEPIAKVWREAFWNATNDTEFQHMMRKVSRYVYPMTPEYTASMVDLVIIEVDKYKDLILKYRK